MKITIETDGAGTSPAATITAPNESTDAVLGDTDGGAGPSSGAGSTGGMATNEYSDGGAPPQSLLDTIAAAEAAERHTTNESDAGGENDAGAGPASA